MTAPKHMDSALLTDILRRMLTIRIFEEKTAELAESKEIKCPVHLYVGQEGIAAGVCAHLDSNDFVFSTHRSHGHYIAKGGDLNALMAEIFGKETGCSRGHGGSMHVLDTRVGFMGSSPIVAGSIPLGVGGALTNKFLGDKNVSVAFFGDGATDEGVFYESVNFATLYKLPMLFVCENNLFSTHMPDFKRQSNTEVYQRIANFNINTKRVDGNNPVEIYQEAKTMIDRAKEGKGPSLLECMTYRWLAHVGPDHDLDIGYRLKKDVDHWKSRCPIKHVRDLLFRMNELSEDQFVRMQRDIVAKVEKTVAFARTSPYPKETDIYDGLYKETV
ncbi:MAG: thiamine pyrophosphate-dependent dehydrogenase E1 component subunit alpha [Candidatus Omnitrophica bacterium]|nr:thiamine pyrophosphate-dependent dehydrogenase E1 component subunit alpha [Candidatus Omnitrophota bacterium]